MGNPWDNPQPVPGPNPAGTPTPPAGGTTTSGGNKRTWPAVYSSEEMKQSWLRALDNTSNAARGVSMIGSRPGTAGATGVSGDAYLLAALWKDTAISVEEAQRLIDRGDPAALAVLAQYKKELGVGGTGGGTGKSAEELALEARQVAAAERANAISALTADIDARLKTGSLSLEKAKAEYDARITALSNQANAINQAQSQFQEAVGWAGTDTDASGKTYFPGMGPSGVIAAAAAQAGLPWAGIQTEPVQMSPGAIVTPTTQGVQVANQGVNFNPADLDAVLEQSMNQLRNYGNG